VRREGYVLKSLTDSFVFPSEALLKISRSLSNRSMRQLSVLAFSTAFLECLLLPLKKRRQTRYPSDISYLLLTHVDFSGSIEMR
jgi:hypothetical protein